MLRQHHFLGNQCVQLAVQDGSHSGSVLLLHGRDQRLLTVLTLLVFCAQTQAKLTYKEVKHSASHPILKHTFSVLTSINRRGATRATVFFC